MNLRKANSIAILLSLTFPFLMGMLFQYYSFFSIDREESTQKIFEARDKIQQEVFHTGRQVRKDFWILSDNRPLQIHVESPHTELRLEKHGSSYELVETLSPAHLWFKDKEEMRMVDVQSCQIFYNDHVIKAFDLSMQSYDLSSFAKGSTLNEYSLKCDGPFSFDPKKKQFIAEKEKEPIHFTHGPLSIDSSCITMEYKDHNPNKISFKTDVQLKNNEMLGKAEQVDYFPKTGRIELLSSPESPVCFWNRKENSKISADRVIIERDPLTREDYVRGVGKVHVSLDENEFINLFTLIDLCTNSLF